VIDFNEITVGVIWGYQFFVEAMNSSQLSEISILTSFFLAIKSIFDD